MILQERSGPKFERMWDDNAEVRSKLATKLRPEYLDTEYKLTIEFTARVRLLLPPGMDKSGKTKYPLLVFT